MGVFQLRPAKLSAARALEHVELKRLDEMEVEARLLGLGLVGRLRVPKNSKARPRILAKPGLLSEQRKGFEPAASGTIDRHNRCHSAYWGFTPDEIFTESPRPRRSASCRLSTAS